jgi:folate-dependent phosphoribosylglycinamide formyltransferase PurN
MAKICIMASGQGTNAQNIIKYFMAVIQKQSNNVTAIATDMYKMRIVNLFKSWLNTNIENFAM